jgi:diaminopimelate decarboxylase
MRTDLTGLAGAADATRAADIASWLDAAGIASTPAYLYDLAEVRRSYARLCDALPSPATLYYSLKANPHPDVLATLRALGAWAEVCSRGELDAAVHAGFAPGRILYTGPGKRDSDIAAALRAGVRDFSCDSPHALDQLDRLAARHGVEARCLIRVNDDRPAAGQGLTMTGVASQFGADASWIEAESERFASRPNARVAGLHLYMGSNLADEDALVNQFARALVTAARLRDALHADLAVVDLGGGFGAPFARAGELPEFPTLNRRLAGLLDEWCPGWRHGRPAIAFESGRYLTATCGRLLTRVLDTKRSHGRNVLVLESGINHLGGMSGLRRLPPVTPEFAGCADREPLPDTLVAGPLCTPLDTWARGVTVPGVRPGDVVVVPNVGAYGLYASLVTFLGHPLPAEIAVDGNRVFSVTRLSTQRIPLRRD